MSLPEEVPEASVTVVVRWSDGSYLRVEIPRAEDLSWDIRDNRDSKEFKTPTTVSRLIVSGMTGSLTPIADDQGKFFTYYTTEQDPENG